MAFLDDMFNGWGTTALVGLGVVVAAPLLLPTVGAGVRPVVKTLIKSGLLLMDSLQELAAEGSEQFSALLAEARAEHSLRAARGRLAHLRPPHQALKFHCPSPIHAVSLAPDHRQERSLRLRAGGRPRLATAPHSRGAARGALRCSGPVLGRRPLALFALGRN